MDSSSELEMHKDCMYSIVIYIFFLQGDILIVLCNMDMGFFLSHVNNTSSLVEVYGLKF